MVWAAILRHPSLKELPVFPVARYFFVYIVYLCYLCYLNIQIFTYWFGHHTCAFRQYKCLFDCADGKIKSARTFEE